MRSITVADQDITSSDGESLTFFARRELRRHIPRKHAITDPDFIGAPHSAPREPAGPGLPHHRHYHRDDAIYGGIAILILIACAFIIGWAWL